MPWVDYRELRQMLKIEEVLAWMNWRANTKQGEQLRGICPLCEASTSTMSHSNSNASNRRKFAVNINRHVFKCFRCGRGGNALDLWQAYRKTSQNAAATELYHILRNQPRPKSSNPPTPPHQPPN